MTLKKVMPWLFAIALILITGCEIIPQDSAGDHEHGKYGHEFEEIVQEIEESHVEAEEPGQKHDEAMYKEKKGETHDEEHEH